MVKQQKHVIICQQISLIRYFLLDLCGYKMEYEKRYFMLLFLTALLHFQKNILKINILFYKNWFPRLLDGILYITCN